MLVNENKTSISTLYVFKNNMQRRLPHNQEYGRSNEHSLCVSSTIDVGKRKQILHIHSVRFQKQYATENRALVVLFVVLPSLF